MPLWKASGAVSKNELVHHQRYATRDEAKASIQEYIENLLQPAKDDIRVSAMSPPAVFEAYYYKNERKQLER